MPTIEWNKIWGKQIKAFGYPGELYGDRWGIPEEKKELSKFIDVYIKPHIKSNSKVLEIGPGGGRWTKYLLGAKEVILVELNPEFFHYLIERFKEDTFKFRFYQTSGYELEGIDAESIDFVFSFGTFVHIDPEGIYEYLKNIKIVLKQEAIAVIQYSDKTKRNARENKGFSDMDPKKMEAFAKKLNLKILDHNTRLFDSSSIIVVQKIPIDET